MGCGASKTTALRKEKMFVGPDYELAGEVDADVKGEYEGMMAG
jgi:hypothetical protein